MYFKEIRKNKAVNAVIMALRLNYRFGSHESSSFLHFNMPGFTSPAMCYQYSVVSSGSLYIVTNRYDSNVDTNNDHQIWMVHFVKLAHLPYLKMGTLHGHHLIHNIKPCPGD